MSILTGKAKSDFEKWYWNDWLTGSDRDYYEKDEVIQNVWKAEKLFLLPLIIEWLDSVGFIIEIDPLYYDGWTFESVVYDRSGNNNYVNELFNTRQEATKAAIEKANELYNKSKNQ